MAHDFDEPCLSNQILRKEKISMKAIYKFIKEIISSNESGANDAFYWLDKIFEKLPF